MTRRLRRKVSENAAENILENPSWLTGGGAESGSSYCRSCAEKERGKHGDDCFVDGGWNQESDVLEQCGSCYAPLASTLSESGERIETRADWEKVATEDT